MTAICRQIGGYASASPLEGSHAKYSSRLLLGSFDMTLLGGFTLLPGQVTSSKHQEILGNGASAAEVA
jgi:hypothetical protein